MEPKMIPMSARLDSTTDKLEGALQQCGRILGGLKGDSSCKAEMGAMPPTCFESRMADCESLADEIRERLIRIEDALFGTADGAEPMPAKGKEMATVAYSDRIRR